MRFIPLAAVVLLMGCGSLLSDRATPPAHAAMPPSTYDGPLTDRLVAEFKGTVKSFQTGDYVAPWANLSPGQYVNPTTGAIEGAALCGKYGHPFCDWGLK